MGITKTHRIASMLAAVIITLLLTILTCSPSGTLA